MSKKKTAAIFLLGAAGYPLLELLWRRRTHVSMALAGGVCFSLLYRIHARKAPLLSRCLMGALAITSVEFVTGLIVNRVLRLGVWDYSRAKVHLLGQVCLLYSFFWFALSGLVSPVCRKLHLYFSKP